MYVQLTPSTGDIWDDSFELQDPKKEHHFISIFSLALSNTEQKQPRFSSKHMTYKEMPPVQQQTSSWIIYLCSPNVVKILQSESFLFDDKPEDFL